METFHKGRIQLGKFTGKLTFILFMSGRIKVLLLNSSLTLYICHWCLECGAQSADEFDLHFFDFPREFLFVLWSTAVSVRSSEHMLSHKIPWQTRGCTWFHTKNYSDTNHTKDFLMTQLSVSAGMSEPILLWHEKGCTQSGSRWQRVWSAKCPKSCNIMPVIRIWIYKGVTLIQSLSYPECFTALIHLPIHTVTLHNTITVF